MDRLPIRRSVCFFGMLTGIALINLALFLHPMNPEDFLELAFSDPLQTVFDMQGGGMAVFFWISTVITGVAMLGLVTTSRMFHRLQSHPNSAMAH